MSIETLHETFNIPKMVEYTKEILNYAAKPSEHAEKLVHESLLRHERFLPIGFDEMGRKEVICKLEMPNLFHDYDWFTYLIRNLELEYETAILANKVWVVRGNKAMPLTKAIKKKEATLWEVHGRQRDWAKYYERYCNNQGLESVRGNTEAFLARLGDVINLDKRIVISMNPGDFLRSSLSTKYTSFNTCHNLKSGSYRRGVFCYALDKNTLVSYIANPTDDEQKMHGRSMLYVSDDLNFVGQRRYYPQKSVFGDSRALKVREMITESLDPNGDWSQNNDQNILTVANNHNSNGGNGYIDAIADFTYTPKFLETLNLEADLLQLGTSHCLRPETTTDTFCVHCGTIHTRTSIVCESCADRGRTEN